MLLAQSVALGLFIGFCFFELTGIVAAGLVTPGYFALYFDQPMLIVEALSVAFITMLCIRLLSFWLLIYGRRRFILTILLGFLIQWIVGAALWGVILSQTRIDAIGFIIPGLIAHEMERQGAGKTLLALFVVSLIVRITLHLLGLI